MSYMSTRINKGDVLYHPKNIQKYIGTSTPVARSSWEIIFMKWADNNAAVIEWCSEPMGIPYIDQTERDARGMPKHRRYFPDFIVKVLNKEGNIDTWVVEIKPEKETHAPSPGRSKSSKTKLYEAKTWATNSAKWRAAEEYCRRRGWYFRILTEKQLINKG